MRRLELIGEVDLPSDRLHVPGWRSGMCPWDGSSYGDRRTGFITQRHCDTCGAHFHEICPECENPQESLGHNAERDEWGCDQCGCIFIEVEED